MQTIVTNNQGGRRKPPARWKAWAGLLLGLSLILVFMFVIIPLITLIPQVRVIVDYAEEMDIDTGALFYTEIEESAEAESYLRDSLRYPPRKISTE